MRAKAGLLYVLNQLTEEGHVYYPQKDLVYKAKEITHHFNRGGGSRRHYI
jgi:hypothetical protein